MGRTTSQGEAFWRAHFERYRSGPVPLREYCERHGLKRSTFGRWRQRLSRLSDDDTGARTSPVNVLRVDIEPGHDAGGSALAAALEVVLGNGRRVRVADEFDAGTLARVVRTLEGL